jgi:hypothetical protein
MFAVMVASKSPMPRDEAGAAKSAVFVASLERLIAVGAQAVKCLIGSWREDDIDGIAHALQSLPLIFGKGEVEPPQPFKVIGKSAGVTEELA